METGIRDPEIGGVELNNVEVCQCPEGYEGDQCELCSGGYYRIPIGSESPLDSCVPCDCNGQSCDPLTGKCQCDDITTGAQCDSCINDYYGAPASGISCKKCECHSSTNTSCVLDSDGLFTCLVCDVGHTGRQCERCLDGYYGNPRSHSEEDWKCQPCDCSGNSDVCNSLTGICIDCARNTGGDHCGTCLDGYYGNISVGCQACNCTGAGYSSTCHPSTGACECLEGLNISSSCVNCMDGFYNSQYSCALMGLVANVSDECSYCVPCDCHTNGTIDGSNKCNQSTGQCRCKDNVGSLDCSVCADGYYGNDVLSCLPCGCSTEGSKPNTTCDNVSGQCQCLHTAIHGRSCDQCLNNTYGDFPLCSFCGECYEGWQQVLHQASAQLQQSIEQIITMSAPYDGYTIKEVQHVLDVVQKNITLSQDLYQSAMLTLNTTRDVKTMFILLQHSLDGIAQSINVLTNQHEAYSILVSNFPKMNLINSSINRLPSKIQDTTVANQQVSSQLLKQEMRWNSTIANLTTAQNTHAAIQVALEGVMEAINSTDNALANREMYFMSNLVARMENLSAQLFIDNNTLQRINQTLVKDTEDLHQISDLVTLLRHDLDLLKNSTQDQYDKAVTEKTSVSSLSSSASYTRQRMRQLLVAVNTQMSRINLLQTLLVKQWEELNHTQITTLDISANLKSIEELSANISTPADAPTLQQIEELIASIIENQVDSQEVDTYEGEVASLYEEADQITSDTLEAEEEVSRAIEQVESAERDLSAAQSFTNQSTTVVDQNFIFLQTSINTSLIKVNTSLVEKSQMQTRIADHLTLFKYLTSQIVTCDVEIANEISFLNITTDELEMMAVNAEQTVSSMSSLQTQLFLRLQLQVGVVQRTQLTVTLSAAKHQANHQTVSDHYTQLIELVKEYRDNQRRLHSLETQIDAAESRLLTLIEKYKTAAKHPVSSGSCSP